MTLHDEPMVIFCPRCGHSYETGRAGQRLAFGSDNCGTTLRVISLTEWREIADQSDFRLTEAGRAAIRKGSD